ncbi:MAG: 50S ribosomal protein L22 [Alphaproteobacteria bacterium]|nr:50S ribosomal protein L22 [Alphaproteobacteria bacterium]
MGQQKNDRKVAENEAMAYGKYIKGSAQKVNLVAQLIRGKNAGKALVDLDFCKRRAAKDVKKVLMSAVANAENNHNLDVDRLVVAKATVGRALAMRRFHARGRGRSSAVEKHYSNLTIVVREQDAEAKKAKVKKDSTKAKPKAGKAAAGGAKAQPRKKAAAA